jgi:hypothetical protein
MTTTGTTVWTIDLPGITHDFKVSRVELSLDELNTVYVHADVTVAPFPDSVDADLCAAIIDGTQRITISADREVLTPTPATQTRTFDLVLHERSIDEAGDVVFQCASDEALLEVRGLVDDDVADRISNPYTAVCTARGVIDVILDEYLSTSLESGTVDADLTRTVGLKNLIPNPSFETNIASWSSSSNATGLVRATLSYAVGVASMRFTAASNGNSSVRTAMISLPAGKRYFSVNALLSSSAARDGRVLVEGFDEDGASTGLVPGPSAAIVGGWGSIPFRAGFDVNTSTSGKPAVKVQVIVQALAAAAGEQFYVDGVSLTANPDELASDSSGLHYYPAYDGTGDFNFFDGDGSPTDSSSYYVYSWDGTPNNSTSTRTPADDRGIQLLFQQPGQAARAFLDPIVDVTGGRLFCDEARDWRLVDGTYAVAGTLALEDVSNVSNWKDTVSLTESFDGVPTTFTGVVVVYETVTRPSGIVSRKYDVAGDDSGRVYRKVVQGAYPGPGAAAALLARAVGRQRSIPVTATTDLAATPSMALTMTIAGTDYTGYASKVVWEWSDTRDQMTITPRDLTEV